MSKSRLRPGDEVIVTTGNYKGKTGKILSTSAKGFVVEGINIRKKHIKKTQENQKGRIVEIECPINKSNVKPFVNGQAVKLRARFNAQGEKEIYFVEEGKEVLHRSNKRDRS